MKDELYYQTKELMTKYGKIDQVFWDGGWLGERGTDADAAFFWEPGKIPRFKMRGRLPRVRRCRTRKPETLGTDGGW